MRFHSTFQCSSPQFLLVLRIISPRPSRRRQRRQRRHRPLYSLRHSIPYRRTCAMLTFPLGTSTVLVPILPPLHRLIHMDNMKTCIRRSLSARSRRSAPYISSTVHFLIQASYRQLSTSNHQLPENSFAGDILFRGVQSFTPPATTAPPLNVEEQFEGLPSISSVPLIVQTKATKGIEDGQDVRSAMTKPPLSASSETASSSSASSSATFVTPAVDVRYFSAIAKLLYES